MCGPVPTVYGSTLQFGRTAWWTSLCGQFWYHKGHVMVIAASHVRDKVTRKLAPHWTIHFCLRSDSSPKLLFFDRFVDPDYDNR